MSGEGWECGYGHQHEWDDKCWIAEAGGSAFPSVTGNPMQDGCITVRDYFAVRFMAAMLPQLAHVVSDKAEVDAKFSARAYEIADAMIAERAK